MFGRGDHGWNDKFLSPEKEMEKVNHLYEIKSKTWQSIELNYQAFILHGWLTNRISHDDAACPSLKLKSKIFAYFSTIFCHPLHKFTNLV